MNNTLNGDDNLSAQVRKNTGQSDAGVAKGRYRLEHYRAGQLIDVREYDNLITTAGKNDLLDKYLAGTAYTAAMYVGLIGSTGYTTGVVAADTSASHAGWVEATQYVAATRPTAAWAAATGGAKSLSVAASFAINAAVTIKGSILCNSSAKSSITDLLFSGGVFTGGDSVCSSGDTVQVSYTISV